MFDVMANGFEIGEIAAGFVARNLSKILEFGMSVLNGAKSELELRIKTAYSTYLKNAGEQYGRAKSFFIRSIPTNIYTFYVPMRVTSDKATLPKVVLNDIVSLTKRAVVTASAGAGKSILLRHLFLDALRSSERIPVFVELRSIERSDQKIFDAIKENLVTLGFDLGDKYIAKGFELGHFVVFLDGFDEVKSEIRVSLSKQIVQLSRNAPDSVIIVSSRRDDVFSGWDDFREFGVSPLAVEEACELVEKLPFDEELKEKFISDLRGFLFERHESFLSNPLLLSIMLLTYGESADIPTKISLFYNQAYEALFQRHDALKGGYQRDRRTSLDIQDFSRVFGAFCVQTYDDRRFRFSRSEALEYVRKAKTYVELDVEDTDYLEDCLQAVCLLMEDGLSVVFSHRSFQEYFVAQYIHGADPLVQRDLLDRFIMTIRTDNVYGLLYEMNSGIVEREVLVPKLKKIFDDIGVRRFVGITHFTRLLKANFSGIRVLSEELGFLLKHQDRREFWSLDVLAFAYQRCVAVEDKTADETQLVAFRKKYSASGASKYDLSKLSVSSPLIKDLAKCGGLFSVHGLQLVLRLSRDLERRHARVRESLDRLLK